MQRREAVDRSAIMALVPSTTVLSYDVIRADGGTQMRAGLNEETVTEYAEAFANHVELPPIVVYYDGTDYWLADGFHRYAAFARWSGPRGLPMNAVPNAIRCNVHSGDRRTAILHAAGANSDHGLRRTNADKRRAVETLLRDDDWGQWSDRQIAEACHVDGKTVAKLRADLSAEIPQIAAQERKVERGGKAYTMDTGKIGKKPKAEEPAPLSPAQAATPALPVPPPYTLDQTIAWVWEEIKLHRGPDPAQRLAWLRERRDKLHTLPGAGRLLPANLQAAANRIERELEGNIEHDRKTVKKQQAQQPKPTMPADLAALGWHLLTLPSGKLYAYNGREQKSTQPADLAATVIDEVYALQQNLVAQPEERLQQRRRYHLEQAIAHLRQAVDVAPADAATLTAHIDELEEMLA